MKIKFKVWDDRESKFVPDDLLKKFSLSSDGVLLTDCEPSAEFFKPIFFIKSSFVEPNTTETDNG